MKKLSLAATSLVLLSSAAAFANPDAQKIKQEIIKEQENVAKTQADLTANEQNEALRWQDVASLLNKDLPAVANQADGGAKLSALVQADKQLGDLLSTISSLESNELHDSQKIDQGDEKIANLEAELAQESVPNNSL